MIDFECIKEITKELRKNFKGIQANSYGYCCCSDYDAFHKHINENDYVCAKIFKNGLNNVFHYDNYYHEYSWDLGNKVWFMWHLENFNIDDIIKVMQEVANEYNYNVVKPKDNSECILLEIKEEVL